MKRTRQKRTCRQSLSFANECDVYECRRVVIDSGEDRQGVPGEWEDQEREIQLGG